MKAGGNPHQWYSPTTVEQVVARVHRGSAQARPGGRGDFDRRRGRDFPTAAPASPATTGLIANHRASATPQGTAIRKRRRASSPRWRLALRLRLLTPVAFLDAVAEGTDPTVATRRRSMSRSGVRDQGVRVQLPQRDAGRPGSWWGCPGEGLPRRDRHARLAPASVNVSAWQSCQLRGAPAALAEATGRDGGLRRSPCRRSRRRIDVPRRPCVRCPRARRRLAANGRRAITFDVEPAEFVAVLGPNGAARSTLLERSARSWYAADLRGAVPRSGPR